MSLSIRWLDMPHDADFKGIGAVLKEEPVRPFSLRHLSASSGGWLCCACARRRSTSARSALKRRACASQGGVKRDLLFITAALPPHTLAGTCRSLSAGRLASVVCAHFPSGSG